MFGTFEDRSPELIFSEAPIKLIIGSVSLVAKLIDITTERKSNKETINKYIIAKVIFIPVLRSCTL